MGVGLWEWDCGTVGGICKVPFHATDSMSLPSSCFFLKKKIVCTKARRHFIYLFIFTLSLSSHSLFFCSFWERNLSSQIKGNFSIFFHLVGSVGYAFERTFGSMDFCLCLHPHNTHKRSFEEKT